MQAVVIGADRIAANGDTANKIGTYGVALLAASHDIPFYVAAPLSTFDVSWPTAIKFRSSRGRRKRSPTVSAATPRRGESTFTIRPSTSHRPA